MTTTQKITPDATQNPTPDAPLVPEVLTEEHHEGLEASWKMPTHDRQAPSEPKSRKPLYVGLIAGALGLTVGFGAGYWAHGQTEVTAAPIVATTVTAGPVDANGMNLGRRIAPIENQTPGTLPAPVVTPQAPGAVDANGMNLGRRIAPIENTTPGALPTPVLVDANGMNMGQRLAPIE